MTSFLPAQLQQFSLAGSGSSSGDTSIILTSMTDIDGNLLTMADLGDIAYGTLEPNNSTQEEQISFTGLTQNVNGSATLTGVKHVLFLSPWTETSGTTKNHPGGSAFILSNTSGFYKHFVSTDENQTVNDILTFASGATPLITDLPSTPLMAANKQYVDNVVSFGAPIASPSVAGLVQQATQAQVYAKTQLGSTTAPLFASPNLIASTINYDYVVDTGAVNAYAIAPTPAITGYVVGQIFSFKTTHTNTGASTLAVSGLATKNIFKNGQFALVGGEIKGGAIVQVEYDGTQFNLLTNGRPQVSQNGAELYATSTTGTTAYIATIVPALTAYAAGLVVRIKPDTGGGHATINLNSLGVKNIFKAGGGVAVGTTDIIANQVIELVYDGTQFQMISPSANSPGYISALTDTGSISSNQNVDTTFTTGFKPNVITLYYLLAGTNSSVALYSRGVSLYQGITNIAVQREYSNLASGANVTVTTSLGTGTPSVGGGTPNSMQVDLSVLSVSATGFVVRAAFTNASSGTGQAQFVAVAH